MSIIRKKLLFLKKTELNSIKLFQYRVTGMFYFVHSERRLTLIVNTFALAVHLSEIVLTVP